MIGYTCYIEDGCVIYKCSIIFTFNVFIRVFMLRLRHQRLVDRGKIEVLIHLAPIVIT